ncbi:Homoserine dehydrogenase [Marinomonas spartinae]|uniref:Homoserine dehydrogenase n=1 Tax=Marinomonas spartinae TaxID=1792290 RepID=A0A1A8TQE1_9GAMM|nr:homoserine dehydrogenase [Marinomonas spartinae]SBS35126.1 Homoserine dehydrogenase [Marinomonas spartinae]SBS36555.1 Homoserine dehydrogenase [Marinomonas spartinae]
MEPVKVGICGLGTVGSGSFNILRKNAEEITRRVGRSIVIEQVGARRDNDACDTTGIKVTRDIFDVANNPDIDIVLELIGGTSVAKELVLTAIENGKHVVTANKALIAEHGNELFARAREKGVMIAFEAAVAGGIPIIKSLREGLSANRIEWLAGIINGTGNFILSEMSEKGRDFDDVLAEAQALGYAEADPTFDIEGIDAAHKLTILASIAFGIPLQFEKTYTEGISRITAEDVAFADDLGYAVKHLGMARRSKTGIELRVHPTLISHKHLLANVNGVMNAVMVKGDAVGPTLTYGAGAGGLPTGSSVVADVIDVARTLTADPHNRVPHLAFQADALSDTNVLSIEEIECGFFLNMTIKDRAGVLATITQILSSNEISIESIIQREREGSELVPLVIMTHDVKERNMNAAIASIEALPDVAGTVQRIRVENLA